VQRACCHLQGACGEEAEVDGVEGMRLILYLSVLRVKHVLGLSYRDAIENLFTSHRAVLVLPLQI
jgi:hypothetical protein